MNMSIFQRMMYVILSITVICAVTAANYIYFPLGSRIPDDSRTEALFEDFYDVNDRMLSNMFPYKEPNFTLKVPSNMSYTTADFQQFEGVYIVEREEPVSNDYLKRICFCGDSLTLHLGLEGRQLAITDVLAYGGVTVSKFAAFTDGPVYNHSDAIKSPVNWLKELRPEIIYVMLGTNGMPTLSLDTHISLYKTLLDKIEAASPASTIVICSVVPWGKPAFGKYTNTEISVLNNKIRFFNMYLLELAKERSKTHSYYFLNGAEAMSDAAGYLNEEYDAGDGIHWSGTGRAAYIDFLLSHPIPNS